MSEKFAFTQKCSTFVEMKKVQENIEVLNSICTLEYQFILDSMIESFRMEGIFIPTTKAQAIYVRVNEKLKKHS